jgi:uncharacterized protein YueI
MVIDEGRDPLHKHAFVGVVRERVIAALNHAKLMSSDNLLPPARIHVYV